MSKKRKGLKTTHHGMNRLKERSGVSKNMAGRMAKRAKDHGIARKDTTGLLRQWLDERNLSGGKAVRVYGGMAYIFSGRTLITSISIPEECRQNLKSFVKPEAFAQYEAYRHAKSRSEKGERPVSQCMVKTINFTVPASPSSVKRLAYQYVADNGMSLKIRSVTEDFYLPERDDKSFVARYYSEEDKIAEAEKLKEDFFDMYGLSIRMIFEEQGFCRF